ncbi:hypothetical protein HDC92_003936 [Pedobacter sp. AK017]|uniref:RagB/SusD family nutrient uptake outer membrane protein n=1 Tax=Pedobacter sp. AK017 TaxID=2723073 RepID=UPI00160C2EB3|nr:RagB/SusD family nutrient uptake outer membrane protein [Pedobacter sp. AK017]MBB5440236.1 hypothetical protein [Pedobacter sp. AK017]
MKYINKIVFTLLCLSVLTNGCRNFITVEPPESLITQQNVFDDDITATGVLTGLYSKQAAFSSKVSLYTGLSADEFILRPNGDTRQFPYYTNNLQATASLKSGMEIWYDCYNYIFICNSAIEGLSSSTMVTPLVRQQLLGEAYFMRAFFYHLLVGLYGDVPLVTGTNPEVNRQLSRSLVADVFTLIISDLLKAQDLLSEQFLNGSLKPYAGTAERTRPNKWAATALLARVYLYSGNFAGSEASATQIINKNSTFNLTSLNNVFRKNSAEAIWQIQPTGVGQNTVDGRVFNLKAEPKGISFEKPVQTSSFLLEAFETGDLRAVPGNWLDSIAFNNGASIFWFPNKYKFGAYDINITSPSAMMEYTMVMRLGEQYLIRAEARARLGDINGAKKDLDEIRNRAGLSKIAVTGQSEMLTAIFQERRVELFGEWTHRWFDMRRNGNIDAIMQIITELKGGSWESKDQLYPIPYEDILSNPKLVQNQGY